MLSEHGFNRYSRLALITLTLVAIIAAFNILRGGVHIDTNLKSLSPSLSQNEAVNQAVDALSKTAAQQFVLAITGDDEEQLELASISLREKIDSKKYGITYVDHTQAMKSYLAILAKHRFQILGEDSADTLAHQTDEQILAAANANLYGSANTVRLISLAEDPMGLVNEYALATLDKITPASRDEIIETSIDGKTQFVSTHLLQLSSDALEMDTQQTALLNIENIKQELRSEYSGIDFIQSGMLFFAADSAQRAKSDINLITTGSTIGIVLLFLLVFRNVKSLIIPIVSMALGTAFALCICHLLFGSIHILTIVFGASLIGVVGDYSLHFYYFYHKKTSKENTLQLYRTLLLSLLTSAIGYVALALSGLGALKQVAVFSGLGLLYAWLIVIWLGSSLIKDKGMRIHDRFLQKIIGVLLAQFKRLNYSSFMILAFTVFIGLLIFNRFHFPANDSPKAFFALNPVLVEQEKFISGLVSTHEPATFIVVDAANAQQLYDRIANVEKKLGNAIDVFGVQDFFPSPEQQACNYELNQRLYSEKGIAGQFLQQNQIDVDPKTLSDSYLQGKDKIVSPKEFFTQSALSLPPFWIESGSQIFSFLLIPKNSDTVAIAKNLSGLDGVIFVSAISDVEISLRHLRTSALALLFVALALISVMVFVQYKFILTLKIMAVPAFSIVLSLSALAALGVPLTLFHIMALFLVLGLSMDYVIFAAEMTENSVETLTAIVLAAITSLLSFGLLIFSSLPAVSAFGLTVILGSALNLFGAMALASQQMGKRKLAENNVEQD